MSVPEFRVGQGFDVHRFSTDPERVMVLGGGSVGARVAERLTRTAEVTLVERDHSRAMSLAERLRKVTIVEGDITGTNLLTEESVATMDVVIAATGEDTANVLACAFAAAESEAFTVVVLHRLALLPLVDSATSTSPRQASIQPKPCSSGALCRSVRVRPSGWSLMIVSISCSDEKISAKRISARATTSPFRSMAIFALSWS